MSRSSKNGGDITIKKEYKRDIPDLSCPDGAQRTHRRHRLLGALSQWPNNPRHHAIILNPLSSFRSSLLNVVGE